MSVYLCEGHNSTPQAFPLFRKLADLAHEGYYTPSDLMHDAVYLTEAVANGTTRTVYWTTREGGGTWIGPALAGMNVDGGPRDIYRIDIAREEGRHWEATITQIDPEGEEL